MTPEPFHRRSPAERPRQILDAALALFGEQGLAGARIEDIAERAGVSKGTIYLYFPSKDELFREMMRDVFGEVLQRVQHIGSGISPRADLEEFCASYWSSLRRPRFQDVYRLVMTEMHRFPELSREYGEEVRDPIRRIVTHILDRGERAGEFTPGDNAARARMLLALLWQHSIWCAKRQSNLDLEKLSDEEVLQQIIAFYMGALKEK